MKELILSSNKNIEVKEFNGQRVVTFKDIDFVHDRVEGTANKRFLDNQKHFEIGIDYFEVTGEHLKIIKQLPNFGISSNANKVILITESGYLMLVKSFTDDLAWKVQRDLVNNYFRVSNNLPKLSKELQAIFALDHKTQEIETRIGKLEDIMTIDYRQQLELNSLAKKVVINILGGKDALAYKELNKKVFSQIWKDYQKTFGVNSYRNTSTKDYEKAKQYINSWRTNRELELMILGANSERIV